MAYTFSGIKQWIYEAMVEADPSVNQMPIRELEKTLEDRRERFQARFEELFQNLCVQFKTQEIQASGDWDAYLKMEKQAELIAKEIATTEALTI